MQTKLPKFLKEVTFPFPCKRKNWQHFTVVMQRLQLEIKIMEVQGRKWDSYPCPILPYLEQRKKMYFTTQ